MCSAVAARHQDTHHHPQPGGEAPSEHCRVPSPVFPHNQRGEGDGGALLDRDHDECACNENGVILYTKFAVANSPKNSAKNSLGRMNDLMTPRMDFLDASDICDGDEKRRDSDERWRCEPVSCGPGVNW